MEITVNGETMEVPKEITIEELLKKLNIDPASVVVELNKEIHNKESFDTAVIEPGAKVEIVSFVGGG